jgi:hypothetical protein
MIVRESQIVERLRVPSSISSEGCPAMVTLPCFTGCSAKVCVLPRGNRRSFDCASRDTAARGFAQDDNFLVGWDSEGEEDDGDDQDAEQQAALVGDGVDHRVLVQLAA